MPESSSPASRPSNGLVPRLLQAAARDPQACALVARGQEYSYATFLGLWAQAVLDLTRAGIRPGQRVALAMGYSPMPMVAILALARIGAISASLSPGLPAANARACCQRLGIDVVIADRPGAGPPGLREVVLSSLSPAPRAESVLEAAPWPEPGAPARLLLTSGTTGVPKAVLETHAGYELRVDRSFPEPDGPPRLLSPGPHIDIALRGCLHAWFEGGAVVFAPEVDDASLLGALRRHAVTHAVFPPVNASHLARQCSAPIASLKHLRLVGAHPTPAMLDAVRERLSPNVFAPYATVEVGVVTMADRQSLASHPASGGTAFKGARIQVVDEHGRERPAGEGGEVRVWVPGMPAGYDGLEGQDGRFRDGWFHTHDHGRVDADGFLYVEGRIDDVLNLGGRKVVPSMVEALLEEFPGVREAAVWLPEGAERLEAAVVPGPELDVAALARFAFERLEGLAPSRITSVERLPRNTLGKLERDKLPG